MMQYAYGPVLNQLLKGKWAEIGIWRPIKRSRVLRISCAKHIQDTSLLYFYMNF